DLPYSIRQKSIELSSKLVVKELYKQENRVETVKNEDGSFCVTMHISDMGKDFMALSLNLPTSAQAEMVKEKFYNNPIRIYNNLINSLFDN
ncbi:MAG: DUF4364 family protein, partial [Clostridiales bacterium]|nr:DUF4364 family protein [Clostridiales bacterium]